MLRTIAVVFVLSLAAPLQALDLTGTLNENADAFQDDVRERIDAEKAANGARAAQQSSSGNSTSFCYAIENTDARYACLGDAFATENLNARNILNGYCSQIDRRFVNSGIPYVCTEQSAEACGALSGQFSELAYACRTCGGSRNWLATVVAGVVYQCS